MPIERIELKDKTIMLVGTAHVSKSSVEEVCSAIREQVPEVVALELCQGRYDVLKHPRLWQETDIVRVIKEKKAALLFANLVMASFQRRIGEKLGVRPGQEMISAIETAEELHIPVALIDRSIQITLSRAWRMLSWRERLRMVWASLGSILVADDLEEEEIERLKDTDMLTAAVGEIAKEAPTIKRVLIDERDAYMARKLADLEAERVLAVIGAGHLAGMMTQLVDPPADLSDLEWMPPKKRGLIKWVIPAVILVLVVCGFFFGGSQQGYAMVKWWLVCNALFAALGALIACGHPLTILVAAVASPITSLNPTLAAGWFAGLAEAYLKRPKVSDFERIQDDIASVTGFWRNPITRILLVVILANLGSSTGALIAMPVLTRIMLSG